MKPRILLRGMLVVAVALATALAAAESRCPAGDDGAKSNTNWLRHYTEACEPLRVAAQDCTLCHNSVEQLNPYGRDLATVGNLPWLVEHLDSDGDGRTNGEEITVDCTLPGDAGSVAVSPASWSRLRGIWR